ncbi:hypothetical protein [Serratia inhibens]
MFSYLRTLGSLPTDLGFRKVSSFINQTPQLPITDGLVGLYFLRNSQDLLKNYANAALPLIKIGNPALGPNYSFVNKGIYYDTGIIPGNNWSSMIITDVHAGGSRLDLSNYGDDGAGDSLGGSPGGPSPYTLYATATPTLKSAGTAVTNYAGFQIIGGVFGSAPALKRIDPATKLVETYPVNMTGAARATPPARTLRIGSHYLTSGGFAGNGKISLVALYNNKILSDAELAQNGQYLIDTWCPSMNLILS